MTRIFLSALLALAPALAAAAQVRAPASAAPALLSVPAVVAPLGAAALVPSLSAASISLLPAAALPSAAPALPALAPAVSAPDRAPPVVLRSFQDLSLLSRPDEGAGAGAVFDGARESFGSISGPAFGKPRVFADMPGVAVKPLRGGLSELQPHEVATIRKIEAFASDLKLLVREARATPDLVVNGIVTELKTVHQGKLDRQLAHANGQLVSHAERHHLGLGAVVLDVIDQPLTPPQIEEKIAQVVREEPAIGFARVYVFHGGEVKTYAPAADGSFRLDALAVPFAPFPTAAPRAPARSIDMGAVAAPSRLLRARGVEATVAMHGSPRVQPPEKAQAKLDALIAEVGLRPRGRSAKARMTEAREALRLSKYYRMARDLGALIASEGGGKVAVATDGGPGIAEAGNRGALEAGGPSAGFNLKLPHEQGANPYATPGLEFSFDQLAARRLSLRRGAMGFVYLPGGSKEEISETLAAMRAGTIPPAPLVLIGERAYWRRVLGDLSPFALAEDAAQAWASIRAAAAGSIRKTLPG